MHLLSKYNIFLAFSVLNSALTIIVRRSSLLSIFIEVLILSIKLLK